MTIIVSAHFMTRLTVIFNATIKVTANDTASMSFANL